MKPRQSPRSVTQLAIQGFSNSPASPNSATLYPGALAECYFQGLAQQKATAWHFWETPLTEWR